MNNPEDGLKIFDINTYLPKQEETFDFLSFAMLDLPAHFIEVVKEIGQDNDWAAKVLESSKESTEQKKAPVL